MAKGYTTRKLEAFAFHIREGNATVNYENIFEKLISIQPSDRLFYNNDRMIALPIVKMEHKRVWFVAYEGEKGINPLIFNTINAKERIQRLKTDEVVANKTHGLIDIKQREAIIEYNHRGAKANDVAGTLESLLRKININKDFTVEFNPVVDENFIKSIMRFEKIRIASLKIARPNYDWTDYSNVLTGVAKESDARTVEVSLYANRGSTLSFKRGIIKYIKDLSAQTHSMMKGAKVIGLRTGEKAETTVSLANHIEHQKINIKMDDDGHIIDKDIRQKIEEYLNARLDRSVE